MISPQPSPLLRNNYRKAHMKPDGYLTIEFPDGTTRDYPFADMKGWSIRQQAVFLSFDSETIIYPLIAIQALTVTKNSKEYVEATPPEPDRVSCKHCTATLY